MKKLSVITFSIFIFCLTSAYSQILSLEKPEEVGMSSSRIKRISEMLDSYSTERKIPGAVCLIARKGKIVFYESFGYKDIENNLSMSKEDLFRIASQSKAIISVAIMILVERGQLNLFDPIGKYIPEFINSKVAIPTENDLFEIVPSNREITIRDLLTHTSGFGYGFGVAQELWKNEGIQDWYFAYRDEPIIETIKRLAALPADAQPGEKFVYGYSSDILGALIEVITNQTLDKFLQSNIFDKLGMNNTFFYIPLEKEYRLTTVYENIGELSRKENYKDSKYQDHYVHGPRRSFSGGAGLVSTAMDYAIFLQMMLNKGIYNGNRILSRKSVELMTSIHVNDATYTWSQGVGFGLGFSVVEDLGKRGILGSNGEFAWGGAYHSTYWVDPKEELIVVYMTQITPIQGVDDQQKLRSLVYQSLID